MLSRTLLCLIVPLCVAWDPTGKPKWFDQWKPTEYFRMSNGKVAPLPLRLHSHETVLTGTADLEQVKQSFKDEYYTPVSIGGKASVQIWMNNFTDTDCGNADTRNPYLETWSSTWVTPKDEPLELPYDSDMSLLVANPKALIWIHRVILSEAPGVDTTKNQPAMGALLGGHSIWGFPKHPVMAKFQYEYQGSDRVDFHVKHLGKNMFGQQDFVDALKVSVQLPETIKGHVALPLNVRTADDGVIGGPLWMCHQVRFGQAINVTQHIAPWDPKTDTIEIGRDDYYSSVLRAWKFEPKLKMHTDDFQIAAFKPANWMATPSVDASGKHFEV